MEHKSYSEEIVQESYHRMYWFATKEQRTPLGDLQQVGFLLSFLILELTGCQLSLAGNWTYPLVRG